jgi:two-component sensor histidine kinase
VSLDIDLAIPLGLIAHELVSNALKHAFPAGRNGEIRLRLRSTERGRALFSVSDDGVGLPPSLDFERAQTLGLKMIRNLTAQIRGRLEIRNSGGTTFEISFDRESLPEGEVP